MANDDENGNANASSTSSSSGDAGPSLPGREQQQVQQHAHEAFAAAPTGTGVNAATMAALQAQLAALVHQQQQQQQRSSSARAPPSAGQEPKEKYAFWETQPVAQFAEGEGGDSAAPGPIDRPKTVDEIPAQPLPLPKGFAWCDVDVSCERQLRDVFELLEKHYVEDDEEAFRFRYSTDFLRWALTPPGHVKEWHVGIRTDNDARRLVGFITAVPATLHVRSRNGGGGGGGGGDDGDESEGTTDTHHRLLEASEVNFLCVHKKLRSRRLAPVLIREVTRRVNRRGVWHAAYTAGVVLPRPVATARYWHRSLDARKLVDVGFCRVPQRTTMARYVKLQRLPEKTATAGLRPMTRADAPAVAALLSGPGRLRRFALAPVMSPEEVAHYLTPREGVIYSYVVEGKGGYDGGDGGAAATGAAEEDDDEEDEEEEEEEEEEGAEGADDANANAADNNDDTSASTPAPASSSSAAKSNGDVDGTSKNNDNNDAAAQSQKNKKNKKKKKRKKKKKSSTTIITDLVSFYTLPSTVVGGRGGHDTLTAAFSFYCVPGSIPAKQLVSDALVLARESGHDVYNALDIADNDEAEVLRELKFAAGDGRLRYYLYNWRMGGKEELPPSEIGLVLL